MAIHYRKLLSSAEKAGSPPCGSTGVPTDMYSLSNISAGHREWMPPLASSKSFPDIRTAGCRQPQQPEQLARPVRLSPPSTGPGRATRSPPECPTQPQPALITSRRPSATHSQAAHQQHTPRQLHAHMKARAAQQHNMSPNSLLLRTGPDEEMGIAP